MSNDLSLTVFDKSVSHAVEKRILSCQSVKRKNISAGNMPCGRIAEVGGYGESSLIKLISQCALCELINCGNHKSTQDYHHAYIDSADLPSEADTSRFLIHFSPLIKL